MAQPSLRHPIVWTTFHGVLWLLVMAGLSVFIPRMESMFLDFGVDLPRGAVLVIQTSHLARGALVPAALALAVFLAIDFTIIRNLSRTPEGQPLRSLWSVGMAALPLGLLALAILTLGSVYFDLTSRLKG